MARHGRSLIQLCQCFCGRVPKHADWMSLVGLANETLTTPALMALVTRFEDQIPQDVCLYVREIFERNVLRNERLAVQLAEAVAAINDRGVIPVLLKGAAVLAAAPQPHWGSRLMSDLDIMVRPDQVEATMNALCATGYCIHAQPSSKAGKWYVDLKRPGDVGMIDLHRDLPGPAFFYRPAGDMRQHCQMVAIGQGRAHIPSPTYQALILTIHDQFQDYDYWIGNIDVRHLIALRDLASSREGIDWNALSALTPSKLARNALETQLVALFCLLDVDVPLCMRSRFVPRLQHWRRLLQVRFPLLRRVLLSTAILDYRNYRDELGRSNKEGEIVGSRRWTLPKNETLRFFLTLSRQQPLSKV